MISEKYPYHPFINDYFLPFAEAEKSFLFDSGNPQQQGRFDFFSAYPSKEIISDGSDIEAVKQKLLASHSQQHNTDCELPFTGGWMGFACYELGYHLEPQSGDALSESSLPLFWAGYYEWAFIIDHEKKHAQLIYQPTIKGELLQQLRESLQHSMTASSIKHLEDFQLTEPFRALSNWQQYQNDFNQIQQYISAGDCYQVNYAQAYQAPFTGSAYQAFVFLRNTVPSPFMVYANLGEQQILSISPERFIQARGSLVQSKPIKGTTARSEDLETDREMAFSLQQSQKNRAENLMIVDLIRNDFGQFCKTGSVEVDDLFAIESFTNVHHLVSTINAKIADNKNIWDLFFGAFPGGSITGAPKIRASQIINELETQNRQIYCGSLFYSSSNGKFDSNIAIRTLLAEKQTLTAWAGGGIVKDSCAEDEFEECEHKISKLLNALNKTVE